MEFTKGVPKSGVLAEATLPDMTHVMKYEYDGTTLSVYPDDYGDYTWKADTGLAYGTQRFVCNLDTWDNYSYIEAGFNLYKGVAYDTWTEMHDDGYDGTIAVYVPQIGNATAVTTTFNELWLAGFNEFGINTPIGTSAAVFAYNGKACVANYIAQQVATNIMQIEVVVVEDGNRDAIVASGEQMVVINSFTTSGITVELTLNN